MALNELNPPSSENLSPKSAMCAWCGKNAEMHLSLLGEMSKRSESFCLACGEIAVRELRKIQKHAEQAANQLPNFAYADPAHKSPLANDPLFEEVEGGIVFWEGHGWSSDGPFAGA
jgi:hypothetical protein